jgi:ferrochelatase
MTYGSPATEAAIPAYLESIRHGSPAPPDILEEFTRRYRRIGFSPLIRITQAQAHALQERLDALHGAGAFRVEAGMLHSEPSIATAVERLAEAGTRHITAVTLAPQYSPIILAGYHRAIDAAITATGREVHASVARAWHLEQRFVAALADRVSEALGSLPAASHDRMPIIFTAHSLPRSVVDRDPEYIVQLHDTVEAVAGLLGIGADRWQFAYQSAGHTPEEWLRPDVKELLPQLRANGHDAVLVVPVQFVSDHLEILYDIDVAAAGEAAAAGITLHRIAMLNTSPPFIDALAAVVRRELAAPAAPREPLAVD